MSLTFYKYDPLRSKKKKQKKNNNKQTNFNQICFCHTKQNSSNLVAVLAHLSFITRIRLILEYNFEVKKKHWTKLLSQLL